MNFNAHSNLVGKHAIFNPSNYYWLGYSDDQLVNRYVTSYASSIGTLLHDIARKYIKHGMKMSKFDKKAASIELLENGIPSLVMSRINFDDIFANVINYVNDGVQFKMSPEVVLYYSDYFFGTADTIQFDEKSGYLRIHDLKTGVSPAQMDQLLIYEALFVLEYGTMLNFKVGDIQSELRIYQSGDIIYHNPTASDILPIMDKIVTTDKAFKRMQERGN